MERDDALLSVTYNAMQEGNKIYVTANYRFKKNIFEAQNYPELKIAFNDITKKFSQMIVLEKE